jgi:transposase
MEKNDSNDAWWLAYVLYEGRMPESFVAEGVMRELRIAARELRWYTNMRADLLRRFKSHLAQLGIAVPKNWQSSKVGKEKAAAALAEVKGLRLLALKMLMKEIKVLSATIKVWRERIAEVAQSLPQVKTMMDELPGFGLIISGSVTGELGDPKRFYSAKAYAKATGLPPGYRESGGKAQATGITRQGSALARWSFTRAIVSCLRCKKGPGAQIKQWVEEHSKTRPKPKMIVAAARKMAEAVWRLFALGEAFDLVKAFPVKGAVPQ